MVLSSIEFNHIMQMLNEIRIGGSIEFNHIMQMLNEIRIDSAKAQGYAISFFAVSLSALFFTLTITVENNFQYVIFAWYFIIMSIAAMILTWVRVKNMKRRFYDIMVGIEKLKKGNKKK